MKAYILLTVDLGDLSNIIEYIKTFRNVTNTLAVYGVYDIVIEVESDDTNYIRNMAHNIMKHNKSITSTTLLMER